MSKSKQFSVTMSINCRGKLLEFDSPKVMGILNLSPDSFFYGSQCHNPQQALSKAKQMLEQGADILDIGAYSSRPGADHISSETELERLLPALKAVIQAFPKAIISVDTFRAEIAKAAIEAGANIINDISAGSLDPKMFEMVATLQVPYILMHMRGEPQSMQQNTQYKHLLPEILRYFNQKINLARAAGIKDLVIDPGFGFAKTMEQCYQLLAGLNQFKCLNLPILIGVSRKSMICKLLNIQAIDALPATSILHYMALQNGANILRVHDVKEAKQVIQRWQQMPETLPMT